MNSRAAIPPRGWAGICPVIAEDFDTVRSSPRPDAAHARRCRLRLVPRRHNLRAMQQPVIERNPDVMGDTPVFRGTRVPVQTLLDYLEAGESIDDFLDGFPSVIREQIVDFLEQAKDRLIETVASGSFSTSVSSAGLPVTSSGKGPHGPRPALDRHRQWTAADTGVVEL